jgi:hypothetical protein
MYIDAYLLTYRRGSGKKQVSTMLNELHLLVLLLPRQYATVYLPLTRQIYYILQMPYNKIMQVKERC